MDMESAPSVAESEEQECALCGNEGTFVIYDGDKVCTTCGHAPDNTTSVTTNGDEFEDWLDERSEYSGWYGQDRIKFAGGFASAYDFGSDF